MLIILVVVFGFIFGFKVFMSKMMNDFFDNMLQFVVVVFIYEVCEDNWVLILEVVGIVNVVNGVNVIVQVFGEVEVIEFEFGDLVKKGDVLICLEGVVDCVQFNVLEVIVGLVCQEYDCYQCLFK